jgi:hypothetical protein
MTIPISNISDQPFNSNDDQKKRTKTHFASNQKTENYNAWLVPEVSSFLQSRTNCARRSQLFLRLPASSSTAGPKT